MRGGVSSEIAPAKSRAESQKSPWRVVSRQGLFALGATGLAVRQLPRNTPRRLPLGDLLDGSVVDGRSEAFNLHGEDVA